MKAVVFYENNPGIGMEEIMLVFPKHEEVERTFVAAGRVIGIGPFAIPGEGLWVFLKTGKVQSNSFSRIRSCWKGWFGTPSKTGMTIWKTMRYNQ